MCKSSKLAVNEGENDVVTTTPYLTRKRIAVILAKIGIASGLISLLASVTVFGLEGNIHERIEHHSAQNQQLYRLKKIDEYYYLTQLKYATLQKLCKI